MASKDNKQQVDPKKDEFKQYLEKIGVTEKLTKLILSLYEDNNKPDSIDEFYLRYFQKKDDLEVVYLKNEVLRLRDELSMKNKEVAELKVVIEKMKEEGNVDE